MFSQSVVATLAMSQAACPSEARSPAFLWGLALHIRNHLLALKLVICEIPNALYAQSAKFRQASFGLKANIV